MVTLHEVITFLVSMQISISSLQTHNVNRCGSYKSRNKSLGTLREVITLLVSMEISISSLQTYNVNRCGRSRHLARKLSLRRKRSSANVFEMAVTETIRSIILIKLIRVSLGTVRHPRRFKIVVIDIDISLIQVIRDFVGMMVLLSMQRG